MIITDNKVIIYTDGSCKGNPGIGGWGAILKYKDIIKELSGKEVNTTNNRMELLAAIEALSYLKFHCQVELYTDSKYLQNGINKWLNNWIISNWKRVNKQPVKNKDLWQSLNKLRHKHFIKWYWIKGHSSDTMNNKVDKLAKLATFY